MYTTNFKQKRKEKYKAKLFSHVSEFLHISWKEQTLIFITEDIICFCWIRSSRNIFREDVPTLSY